MEIFKKPIDFQIYLPHEIKELHICYYIHSYIDFIKQKYCFVIIKTHFQLMFTSLVKFEEEQSIIEFTHYIAVNC